MKSTIGPSRFVALGAILAALPLSMPAQDNGDSDWNHFGLNLRAGFNIRAKFSESATPILPAAPGAGANVSRQYNDGYVDVDSSGNQGGSTWNWSYQHPSQVSGGNLLMHASAATGGSSQYSTDDPNLGLDFNYIRDLGHEKWGQWGVKIAFGYTPIGIHDSAPIGTESENVTDAYALNGVVPPTAPYTGSFSGPGPVIGSRPISRSISTVPDGGFITGTHSIDASLYDLRLGPSFNIPIFKRFSFQAGGGIALGVVDSNFKFTENNAGLTTSGKNDRAGFLPGAYAEVGFAYKICHSTSVFTGAQFQYLEDFDQNAAGRTAHLDFGQTIFYELGLEWNF